MLFVMVSIVDMGSAVYGENEDDDRIGFGEMEREREHQDEGIPLNTDVGNIILYGTITAIGVSIFYTAFKIMASKRKSSPKS